MRSTGSCDANGGENEGGLIDTSMAYVATEEEGQSSSCSTLRALGDQKKISEARVLTQPRMPIEARFRDKKHLPAGYSSRSMDTTTIGNGINEIDGLHAQPARPLEPGAGEREEEAVAFTIAAGAEMGVWWPIGAAGSWQSWQEDGCIEHYLVVQDSCPSAVPVP